MMTEMSGFGATAPIVVEIRGYDQKVALDLGQKIASLLRTIPGIKDVRVEREAGAPELQIKIDREKASDLGLNLSYIASTIQTNMEGSVASFFRDPQLGKEYDILVQLREKDRKDLFELDRISLILPTGGKIPLSSVATVVKAEGPKRIERKNQERILTVTSQVSGRPAGNVAREVKAMIKKEIEVPSNFIVTLTGSYQDQQESFISLFLALLLAVALVYIVLAAQFESLLEPFIIMFSVPLGILGVIWGLFLTGFSVNVLSLIGLIMMAGIVVSNAILLVDYSNVLLRRGLSLYEAVVTAGRTRLRPVLMTTLTTIFALLPMAIGIGEGSEIQSPMAVAVISGLLVSTLLTLVFIPTLYIIVQERIRKRK
jgi:HAE1 family hydrophobic/amphiphilic exporter-1